MRKIHLERKIKVLWLPSWYPHAGHPMLGNFTRRDAEAVAPYAEVVVLFVVEADGTKRALTVCSRESGFVEVFIIIPRSQWKFFRFFRLLGAYRMGRKYLAANGFIPDLIHLHVLLPAGIGALYLRWKLGVSLIVSEHWSGFLMPKAKISWFHRWLLKTCTSFARTILTVTPEMADGMRKVGVKGRFVTNPNVVDMVNSPFKNKREEGNPTRFIHVSSLDDDHKNVSGILQAFHKVSIIRQDFSLEIIGGDEGTETFESLAIRLGIEKQVCFRGRLPHREVMLRLADSDVFVLFSNREGLPCVLLEAMAVGLPVISTDLPGLADWIPPENGLRVPIGDIEKLQLSLLEMMTRLAEFDGKKIRSFIEARCSYEVVGKRIHDVYQEVLAIDKNSS